MDEEYRLERVKLSLVSHLEEDIIWLEKLNRIVDEVVKRGGKFIISRQFDFYVNSLKHELKEHMEHKKALLEIWK